MVVGFLADLRDEEVQAAATGGFHSINDCPEPATQNGFLGGPVLAAVNDCQIRATHWNALLRMLPRSARDVVTHGKD